MLEAPPDWRPNQVLMQWVGVPVFTSPTRPVPASAFYSTGDSWHGDPYIWIRPRYVRALEKVASGRQPRTVSAWRGFSTLANEYAHKLGIDSTDSAFNGGIKHRPTIMKLTNELLDKAGVKGSYRKWILRNVYRDQSATISIPSVAPPTPAPSTMPVIGA